MKCQDGWDAFVLPSVLPDADEIPIDDLSPIGLIPEFETSPIGEVLPPVSSAHVDGLKSRARSLGQPKKESRNHKSPGEGLARRRASADTSSLVLIRLSTSSRSSSARRFRADASISCCI